MIADPTTRNTRARGSDLDYRCRLRTCGAVVPFKKPPLQICAEILFSDEEKILAKIYDPTSTAPCVVVAPPNEAVIEFHDTSAFLEGRMMMT